MLQALMDPDQEERYSEAQLRNLRLWEADWKQLHDGLLRSPLAEHVGTLLRAEDVRNAQLPDFVQGPPPTNTFVLDGF